MPLLLEIAKLQQTNNGRPVGRPAVGRKGNGNVQGTQHGEVGTHDGEAPVAHPGRMGRGGAISRPPRSDGARGSKTRCGRAGSSDSGFRALRFRVRWAPARPSQTPDDVF